MRKVFWHEGMLISPQHFQLTDAYHEENSAVRDQWNHPYNFGIRECKFDTNLLAQGILSVESLQAIMPDYTAISWPSTLESSTEQAAKPHTLQLNISDYGHALEGKPLRVYLVIYKRHLHTQRYLLQDIDEVPDFFNQHNQINLTCMTVLPWLSLEKDLSAQHVAMPLCEVGVQQESYYITDYLPPLCCLTLMYKLYEDLNSLAGKLRRKVSYMAAQLNNSSNKDLHNILRHRIGCICPHLFDFEGLLHSALPHPFAIYQSLLRLAGALCTIGNQGTIPLIPFYNHFESQQAFNKLLALIDSYLGAIEENYISLPMEQKKSRVGAAQEEVFYFEFDERFQKSTHLWVGVRSNTKAPLQAATWLEDAIIVSSKQLENAKEHRFLGAKRELNVTNDSLPLPKGVILTKIFFDDIYLNPHENICILNPSAAAQTAPEEIMVYLRG